MLRGKRALIERFAARTACTAFETNVLRYSSVCCLQPFFLPNDISTINAVTVVLDIVPKVSMFCSAGFVDSG